MFLHILVNYNVIIPFMNIFFNMIFKIDNNKQNTDNTVEFSISFKNAS